MTDAKIKVDLLSDFWKTSNSNSFNFDESQSSVTHLLQFRVDESQEGFSGEVQITTNGDTPISIMNLRK